MQFKENFIGGKRIESTGNKFIEVRSPYDGSLTGSCPLATKADIDMAVAAARKAFDYGPWPLTDPKERQEIIAKFSALFAGRAEEFANFITRENGIALWCSTAINNSIASQNDSFLRVAESFPWEETKEGFFPGNEFIHRREPVGVVAAIIPWNAPLQSAMIKIVPALLAGCCVILKTAPETAVDGHFLGELLNQAGVPEGVVSIICADREESEYLVAHPGVDKIAFTGSTATGKKIAQAAGFRLKRYSLELGGKSAAIITEDADIVAAAETLKYGAFINSGQACIGQTRILAPKQRYREVVDELVKTAADIKLGNPLDKEVFMGPVVSKKQQEKIWDYIKSGVEQGAKLEIGGPGMPDGIKEGAFVMPTVFSNVNNSMRIAREEIFGPVICVIEYNGIDEAISIANDSSYGLYGAVYTADKGRGIEIARQIRTGTFGINGQGQDYFAPFGGFKESGVGREFGFEGLAQYTEHKAIMLPQT